MKKYTNKIIIAIGIIFIIISTVIGKNLFDKGKEEHKKIGYRLQVVQDNANLSQCSMNINENEAINYKVNFTNGSDKRSDFILTLYLNYNQIEFNVDEKYKKKYQFNLKPGEKIGIPVLVNVGVLPYKNNSLIFNITAGANKHASSIKEVKNFFGINAEYNLIIDRNSDQLKNHLVDGEKYQEIKTDTNFDGILLNQDIKDIDIFKKPNSSIYCKTNEEVDLALRFGGYSGINNYLILLVLDNEKIKINNSEDYLFYNYLHSSRYFTQISFKAPSKPEKYELWAMMAKNPINFQDNPLTFRRRSLDYSHRITLIVE